MKRSLQDIIKTYNFENGYEDSPSEDYEYFIECLSEGAVQEETFSEHRWYDIRDVVHKVTIDGEERFFQTFYYHTKGDNSAGDMDLNMPTLDDVYEVFPHEVVKVVYK